MIIIKIPNQTLLIMKMRDIAFIFWIITSTICINQSLGVRFRIFLVPKEVRSGANVTLECQVDTWPSPLYSLAWWKDGAQFYRTAVTKSHYQSDATSYPLSPTNKNFAQIFALPGLNAKIGRRLGEVMLQEVDVTASGNYSCEAVTDFPTFSQSFLGASFTVVEPPATKPIISGFKGRYYPGEVLTPNCTVLRTYPQPAVTWIVNEQQLRGKVIEIKTNPDNTLTLTDQLKLQILPDHFRDGIFNLTCGATIGEALWSSTSITARRAHPRKAETLLSLPLEKVGLHDVHGVNAIDKELLGPYQRLQHSGVSPTNSLAWESYLQKVMTILFFLSTVIRNDF